RAVLRAPAALRLPPQRGGPRPRRRASPAGGLGGPPLGPALGRGGSPPRGLRHADGAPLVLPDLRDRPRRGGAGAALHLSSGRPGSGRSSEEFPRPPTDFLQTYRQTGTSAGRRG